MEQFYFYKNIFIAILISGFLCSFYLVHDDSFKNYIEKKIITEISKKLGCQCAGRVHSFDVLTGDAKLLNISLYPVSGNEWRIDCKTAHIHIAPLNLILYGLFDITLILDDVYLESTEENNDIACVSFFKKFFQNPSNVSTLLRQVTINKAHLTINNIHTKSSVSTEFSSKSESSANGLHTTLFFDKGLIMRKGSVVYKKGSGSLNIHNSAAAFSVLFQAQGHIPMVDNQAPCTLSGEWQNRKGTVSLLSTQKKIAIDSIQLDLDNNECVHISGSAPLDFLAQFIPLLKDKSSNSPAQFFAIFSKNIEFLKGTLTVPHTQAIFPQSPWKIYILQQTKMVRDCKGFFPFLSLTRIPWKAHGLAIRRRGTLIFNAQIKILYRCLGAGILNTTALPLR